MTSSLPSRWADVVRRGRARLRALPGGAVLVRLVVSAAGLAVIVVGIVLLPLPGPGWLIIFAGLGILATEYAWAGWVLRHVRRYVHAWTRWVLHQPWIVRALVGLAGMAIVAGALWLSWWLVR